MMMKRKLIRHSIWFLLLSFIFSFFLVGSLGCAAMQSAPEPEPIVIAPPPPPEPAMQVTRDTHLTLFGELPDRHRVPYQARASAPMTQHSFSVEGADFDVDVAADGEHLVFSSTRHSVNPDIYTKVVDGRAVTQVTSDPAADVQPCFSPDGERVVFASYRSGNWDLWMAGLDGGQATQITYSRLHEVHPSFAPDGRRLVYCMFNDRSEQWELWLMDLARPSSRRMIGVGLFPEWSPTADSIVYQRARERGGRWFSIWRLDLVNGEPKFPVELASSSEMALIQPSWSPDGEWVTYGTAELASGDDFSDAGLARSTRGDIWIMQSDGTSPLRLTEGAGASFGSVWNVDGRVYFTSLQNGSENIWSVRPLQVETPLAPVAGRDSRGLPTASRSPDPGLDPTP